MRTKPKRPRTKKPDLVQMLLDHPKATAEEVLYQYNTRCDELRLERANYEQDMQNWLNLAMRDLSVTQVKALAANALRRIPQNQIEQIIG